MKPEAAALLLLLAMAVAAVVVATMALATQRPQLRPLHLTTQAVQRALQPATQPR